jgi:hypothetical protein
MNPINPFTLGAASLGIAKLAQVARPIADFALGVVSSPEKAAEPPAPTPLGPRERIAQDAHRTLQELAQKLEEQLGELGIALDEPVELQLSPSGRIVVANNHAASESIEEILAGSHLGHLFGETAARFQELEAYPESQLHPDAPRKFQVRFGNSELHAGFVA